LFAQNRTDRHRQYLQRRLVDRRRYVAPIHSLA
jgi:hypothetical protein